MTGCEKILKIVSSIQFDKDLRSCMNEEIRRDINVDISFYITQFLYEGTWEI